MRGSRLKVQCEAQVTVWTRGEGGKEIVTLSNACRDFGGQKRGNRGGHDTDLLIRYHLHYDFLVSVSSGTQRRREWNNELAN